jgi:hypothetical protein
MTEAERVLRSALGRREESLESTPPVSFIASAEDCFAMIS